MTEDAKKCHCGKDAVAECPCCEKHVCAEHLAQAAKALAEAVGLGKKKTE